MVNPKDVILAVLVAYIVLDFTCTMMLRRKRPALFRHLLAASKKDRSNILLCVVAGLLAGGATYYLSSQY